MPLWKGCLGNKSLSGSCIQKRKRKKKKPNVRAYTTSLEWCSEKRYLSTLLRPESFLESLSVFNFCLFFWESHFNCEFTVFSLNWLMIKQDCCRFLPQCLESTILPCDGAKSSRIAQSFVARVVHLRSFLGNGMRLASYRSLGKSATFLFWPFAPLNPFFHPALCPGRLSSVNCSTWVSLPADCLLGSDCGSLFPAWLAAMATWMASILLDSPEQPLLHTWGSHMAPFASSSQEPVMASPVCSCWILHSPLVFSWSLFTSVAQSCLTLCDPVDCSTPGFPVHHQLLELAQSHIHRVGDAIQPSHPLSSPSPPAFILSQYHGLFQWVSSSHQVAKVLEFQLQHQSFQWIFRTDFL